MLQKKSTNSCALLEKLPQLTAISAQQSNYENLLWTQKGHKYKVDPQTGHVDFCYSALGQDITPSPNCRNSLIHRMKSFLIRQSPTLLQDLWNIYRNERLSAQIFARQTVKFNPERSPGERLTKIFYDGSAALG
jgi:hypothetical protein